jgi:dTDP-4-dehydrorhamnose reductase
MARILVTGAAGRLGGSLLDALTRSGHEVTGTYRQQMDITNFAATRAFITGIRPDLVIHPAAWTDVDGCAREPEKALIINGYGAQNVAIGAAEAGAAVLYVSSNEVFDGAREQPYLEFDNPAPVNAYGYSKLVGERAVAAVNPRHYIVRTAWIFAHSGKNFIQAILNAAASGKHLRVVTDEVANPTYNDDLATAIAALIDTGRYGTYHLTNEGICSRYEFARHILDRAGFAETPIEPIQSHDWPRDSTPPLYCALANVAGALVGVSLRPWQDAVNEFVAREGLLEVKE